MMDAEQAWSAGYDDGRRGLSSRRKSAAYLSGYREGAMVRRQSVRALRRHYGFE